tara:strand:+ start:18112 stop:18507 length:396 start_codon:yes stop_codon:yes gene_type:complete
MNEFRVSTLRDLDLLRTAPVLNALQTNKLFSELIFYLDSSDWFTVGIMAPEKILALNTLRKIETRFNWEPMKLIENTCLEGPVFLKANQNTGNIYIRTECGLGIGVLLGCQHYNEEKISKTFGPFPLEFFD